VELPFAIKLYRVKQIRMDSLPVEWVDHVADICGKDKVIPVTFKAYKEEMMGQLTHVIESQGLSVSNEHEELIQQLKSFKKQGRPHYDDLVDGLMLATYQNDLLFPEKKAGNGCAVFIDLAAHTVYQNYGNRSTVNVIPNPNRWKKGVCSRS